MGNSVEKEKQLTLYYNAVNKKDYGVMYAKYNVILFAENEENRLKAIEIAKQEVEERPTAQSYDLLAWAYFKNNNKTKALEIVEKYVINNTFEPEALLHTAQILKANGKKNKATNLKLELLGAIYELGPNAEQEIKNI